MLFQKMHPKYLNVNKKFQSLNILSKPQWKSHKYQNMKLNYTQKIVFESGLVLTTVSEIKLKLLRSAPIKANTEIFIYLQRK